VRIEHDKMHKVLLEQINVTTRHVDNKNTKAFTQKSIVNSD